AAIKGLALDDPCIDLNVEGPSIAHFAIDFSAEAIFAGATWAGKHFAAYGFESIIAVINLSIALETFSDDPDKALADRTQRLQEQLKELGFTGSLELFLGGGVDLSATHCELKVTPIFRHADDAIAAASAIGRSRWLVAKWRSDQSGGMTLVQSEGF